MADVLIPSLRGGYSEQPAIALDPDQCVVAQNVEFWQSQCGERRRGSAAIDLTGSPIEGCDRVVFKARHLPTTDLADAQLWALGITDPSTAVLTYKDTTWHTVTMSDALTIDGASEYQVHAQTLHGKLFLAYNSGVDRLHVWDGTSLRRCGLAEPAAPTAANTGSGALTGERSYRVRFTRQVLGATVLRSEPSDVLAFTPSGSGSAVRVTKPAIIGESETHWELEASPDGGNFYVIATSPIATTFVDDATAVTDYGTLFELAEDIGDYALLPSVRYLTSDDDRLLAGGGYEDPESASRVMWTPVRNSPGVGNDERLKLSTDPSVDLDNYEGGGLSGLAGVTAGYVNAFKSSHTYRLVRRGTQSRAYEVVPLTKQRGAIPRSIVDAFDEQGRPFVFFLDPDIGPCALGGERGVSPCGVDLIRTWETVNLDASLVAHGVYFPEKKQVHWWISTGDSETPDTRIVLQTNEMRYDATLESYRKGWLIWTGPSAAALTACLYSANIDADTDRSLVLVPFIGVEGDGLIWMTETGDDDAGTDYTARVRSKPFVRGNLLHRFGCRAGAVLARTAADARIDVSVIGQTADEGLVTTTVSVELSPLTNEGDTAIRGLDNLGLADLNTIQVEIADAETPGAQWHVDQIALLETPEQRG